MKLKMLNQHIRKVQVTRVLEPELILVSMQESTDDLIIDLIISCHYSARPAVIFLAADHHHPLVST